MQKGKLCLVLMLLLLQGCFGATGNKVQESAATNAIISLVTLPFKIVGVAVAAAIGAAAGMGMMEDS